MHFQLFHGIVENGEERRYGAGVAGKITIRELEKRLKALANRKRLQILAYLKRERSAYVSEIARAVSLSVTATSNHLQILKNADIVVTNKRGLYVPYRITLHPEEPARGILKGL